MGAVPDVHALEGDQEVVLVVRGNGDGGGSQEVTGVICDCAHGKAMGGAKKLFESSASMGEATEGPEVVRVVRAHGGGHGGPPEVVGVVRVHGGGPEVVGVVRAHGGGHGGPQKSSELSTSMGRPRGAPEFVGVVRVQGEATGGPQKSSESSASMGEAQKSSAPMGEAIGEATGGKKSSGVNHGSVISVYF